MFYDFQQPDLYYRLNISQNNKKDNLNSRRITYIGP